MNENDKDYYPTETPWGPPQDVDIIAPGIVSISTAGHGGIWLSPERSKKIPLKVKRKTFCQNGLNGWYEEDCDAQLVSAYFPEEFKNCYTQDKE